MNPVMVDLVQRNPILPISCCATLDLSVEGSSHSGTFSLLFSFVDGLMLSSSLKNSSSTSAGPELCVLDCSKEVAVVAVAEDELVAEALEELPRCPNNC